MDETSNGAKSTSLIAVIGYLLLLVVVMPIVSANNIEIRGQVTNVGVSHFTWDNSNFAGFYYDIHHNLGAEALTFRLTDTTPTHANLTDIADPTTGLRGVVYQAHAQLKVFKYKAWGQYHTIGFLSNRYFTAYSNIPTTDIKTITPYLYDVSKNRNLMTNAQISKVLIDDNKR